MRRLGRIVRLVLVAALVGVALVQVDLAKFLDGLSWQLLWVTLIVQPLVLVSYLPVALRFQMLTREPNVRLRDAYAAVLVSMALNLVLPGRLAELLKVVYLHKHGKLSVSHGLSALMLERIGDVVTVAMLGLFGVNLFFFGANPVLFWLVIGFAVASLASLPYLERHMIALVGRLRSLHLRDFLVRTLGHAAGRVRDRTIYRSFGAGLLSWVLWFVSVYLFIHLASAIPIGLEGAFVLFVATAIGGAIPALPGGLGTYEAAAVYVLLEYGYTFEGALAMGLALHFGQLVGVFLAGNWLALRHGAGVSGLLREVRQILSATAPAAGLHAGASGGPRPGEHPR